MKVGILTFHWSSNYGAVVQAVALSHALEQLGHEPMIVDRQRVYKGFLRRLYHRFSFKHKLSWNKFWLENEQYLHKTPQVYLSTQSMQSCIGDNQLDAIVVGSDQVWRWLDVAGYNYFLDFCERDNCRKISYAASFGFSKWPYGETQTSYVKSLIERFDNISVREESGVRICKDVFAKDATLVLDPTMLHNAEFYVNLFGLKPTASDMVVSYTLGDNRPDLINVRSFALQQGCLHKELFLLKSEVSSDCKDSCPKVHYSLREWLLYILNAKIVVTSSFHATVFSILFHKEFYVLKNQSGGMDRIYTLLACLGLADRVVDNLDEVKYNKIDYEQVESKLATMRLHSFSYLKNALI